MGDLQELADSLREVGPLQALLGRPADGGRVELAAGERRRRAGLLAKVDLLPVVVREISDEEMVEIQLHENKGREDLHPMDEAELYEELARRGRSATAIAQKLGCDPSHVRRRLVLCGLSRKVRAAYVKGDLSHYAAFAIARVKAQTVQERFAADIAKRGGEVTDAVVCEILRRSYVLPLAQAPWRLDDEEMDPAAGSCVECPKRTLEQRDLFADVYAQAPAKEDYCTDASCWKGKGELHWKRVSEAAAAAGATVLAKGDGLALFQEFGTPGERRRVLGGAYVDADGQSRDLERTWRQFVGQEPTVLARDPDGVPRWLYPDKVARTATRAQARERKRAQQPPVETEESRARDARREAEAQTAAMIAEVAEVARECVVANLVLALVNAAVVAMPGAAAAVARRRGYESVDELLGKARGAMTAKGVLAEVLLTEAADQEDADGVSPVVLAAAKLLGVGPERKALAEEVAE